MPKTVLPTLMLVTLTGLACTTESYADPALSGAPPKAGDFRFQKTLTADTRLEIHDQNGPIGVEAATGDSLEVVAIKTGRAADLDRVKVIAREEGGAIVICALWPGQDASTCRPGSAPSGHDDDSDTKVRVEFRVRVPAKVTGLVAKTMNGEISAQSPAGEVRLETMNGSIAVTARGAISAETYNGSVVANAAAGSPVHLETKNGRIEVLLPAAVGADVDASTLHGRITSELGVVPEPRIPAIHEARFRIGAGGVPVSLHTLNGNIAVRRAGA